MKIFEIKKAAIKKVFNEREIVTRPLFAMILFMLLVMWGGVLFTINTNLPNYGIAISPDNFISITEYVVYLIQLVILVPLHIGYMKYLMNIDKKDYEHTVRSVFEPYKYFNVIAPVVIITNVLTFMGSLLLIIPGIIFSILFAFTYPIIADGEKSIKQVFIKSKNLVRGYKWHLILFTLTFLPTVFLGLITLGLWFFIAYPYIMMCIVMYYQYLRDNPKK